MEKRKTTYILIGVLLGIVGLSVIVQLKFFDSFDKEHDIYWIYNDSKYIVDGKSPYNRIKGSDMRVNQKYATYFPLFFLSSAGIQLLGFRDYEKWVVAWRILYILVSGLISWIILRKLSESAGLLTGILGALFWQFHVYARYVFYVAQIDFLALLFLIWSLTLFDKNLTRSMVLFGVSFAFKQIGIFLIPLYILASWHQNPNWLSAIKKSAIYIGMVPLISFIPFLIKGAKSFIYSIFFSATREAASHLGIQSLDTMFEMKGLISTLPMLILMLLVFIVFAKKKIKVFLASVLIMQIFIGFNSVLFKQYLVWPLVLLPFLIVEFRSETKARVALKE